MLLAVVLAAATTYFDGAQRKEALEPVRSQEVRASYSNTQYQADVASSQPMKYFIADILQKNNYTGRLYGRGQFPTDKFHEWVNDLTVIYPALLDEPSKQNEDPYDDRRRHVSERADPH